MVVPAVDLPSWDREQAGGGGGVKLASARLPSIEGGGLLGGGGGVKLAAARLLWVGVGVVLGEDGGSRVLLGLSMSPSPTRVRSVWVSSSTVRRVVLSSDALGSGMGDRCEPKEGCRGGGSSTRRGPKRGPSPPQPSDESRLSERRPQPSPRAERPFSRSGLAASGVEQGGGAKRRKSGSTKWSLFRRPRWSLARADCARLSSSKNSANTQERCLN